MFWAVVDKGWVTVKDKISIKLRGERVEFVFIRGGFSGIVYYQRGARNYLAECHIFTALFRAWLFPARDGNSQNEIGPA